VRFLVAFLQLDLETLVADCLAVHLLHRVVRADRVVLTHEALALGAAGLLVALDSG